MSGPPNIIMLKNVRTHTFRGKSWKIKNTHGRAKYAGDCDPPVTKDKVMHLKMHSWTRDDLDTILHECLHACFWDLSEDAVTEYADATSKLLFRLGWRNVNDVIDRIKLFNNKKLKLRG